MGKKDKPLAKGTKVKFKGYDDDDEGDLEKGAECTITGSEVEDGDLLYNVEDEDGNSDSLYPEEFKVIKDKKGKDKSKEKSKDKKGKGKGKGKSKTPARKSTAKKTTTKKTTTKQTAAQKKVAAKAEEKAKAKAKADKAKAKAKADKEKAERAEAAKPLKFKKTVSVIKELKDHKGSVLDAVLHVATEKERTVFTLGGLLALIKREDAHVKIMSDERDENKNLIPMYDDGVSGFNDYVSDELGIKSSMAIYYVRLYEKFSQITTEQKIARIGWTKLRELLPVNLTPKNVDKWIEYAKTHSTVELKDKVTAELVDAAEKGDGGGEEETHGNKKLGKRQAYKFLAHEDQVEMVDSALEEARDVIGEESTESQCFIHILQEWVNFDSEEEEGEESED